MSRTGFRAFLGHDFHRSPSKCAVQARAPVVDWLQFSRGEISMMTDPATAIRREVVQLIDQQIETLRGEEHLTDTDLDQFRLRSGRISDLYQEHDRIVKAASLPFGDSPGPRSFAVLQGGARLLPRACIQPLGGTPVGSSSPVAFCHAPGATNTRIKSVLRWNFARRDLCGFPCNKNRHNRKGGEG
jgi:hypothetical protein